MINFSTEFPIDHKVTVEAVIRLACLWVCGSPHTTIPKGALNQLPINDEQSYSSGNEEATTAIASMPDFEIGGMRYFRRENGLEWTSSIVALKTASEHQLSIQVFCEALNTAVRLPDPKKPYFVRQALLKFGGGMDGQIPVADMPFRLDEGEPGVAAALMLGTAKNRLPIIYASAGFDGTHTIDSDEMARLVSGMSHVVVEPSRTFSNSLRTLTNAHNVYGGTVGVYWPESSARKSYFLDSETPTPRSLQLAIAKDIRLALCNRRLRTNCTWANIKETIARKKYERLKAEGSTELQSYVDAFDADQTAKDARLLDAEREISRLDAEVRRLSSQRQGSSSGLLIPSHEQDLFEDEGKDIVIEALQQAMRAAGPDSRKRHVIAPLLERNKASGQGKRMEYEIKELLKTYREMDSKTRSALARLGFDISEDGKHYKAVFHGDGRYTFILPKTSSDHRAGRNLASDIVKMLF